MGNIIDLNGRDKSRRKGGLSGDEGVEKSLACMSETAQHGAPVCALKARGWAENAEHGRRGIKRIRRFGCHEEASGEAAAKVVVVGGGWAGCAAAIRAAKLGCRVTLIERTDMLLGLGNVGGIMRNNGRFTATEENIAMGAKELFEITDRLSTHRNVDFPGHAHASFYDVAMVEPEVRRLVLGLGAELVMMGRAVGVCTEARGLDGADKCISAVKVLATKGDGSLEERLIEGDVFVETTGSTGPMGNCVKQGRGCAMCVLRCPAFGSRVSLTEAAGGWDLSGQRADGSGKLGAFSGSCKLEKRTLSEAILRQLERDGYAVVPLPEELVHREKLAQKVCQQYALDSFAENLIIIDTGHAKLMTSYFSLEELRRVPGFENVRFADPYAGGKANSVRYMSVGLCDRFLRATCAGGVSNLFLGGEKSGFFVGHTEAITTGSLAGYNAACMAKGACTCAGKEELLELPRTLAAGELLAYSKEVLQETDGLERRLTFAGGEFFERMKALGLYSQDVEALQQRVEAEGLVGVYDV